MGKCHDMKKGEIYYCEDCGIELQVIKECSAGDDCKKSDCKLVCCNMELKLKK